MDFELISVLVTMVAVGITLAGLFLATVRGLRQEIRDLRGHMGRIDSQIGELRERMAHVEGLLMGLRDSLARRISTS